MLSKVRKIKPIHFVVVVILLIAASYVGLRQYTVISCQKKTRAGWSEYVKGKPGLRLSDQALYFEGAYQACMRDKGFSG